jgi:hypothetical protein
MTANEVAARYPVAGAALPLAAQEATLCAGDVLLLPPFWFHRVLTLSDSVSVNAWSDAPEYVLIHEIYELPVRGGASITEGP